MNNLILDCSCGMNVYVVCDEKFFSRTDGTQNKHTDEILKVVDELLKEAKISIKEIDNICVCVGPGSFTGVRVAISIAKGLALGVKAKVFVLTNFDCFEENNKDCYIVLDGFSDFAYVRTIENGSHFDDCYSIEDFVEKENLNKKQVYVSTEKTQNLLKNHEIQSNFGKLSIISAFNEVIKNGNNVELNKIFPVYLRASQAEIERAKKLNK